MTDNSKEQIVLVETNPYGDNQDSEISFLFTELNSVEDIINSDDTTDGESYGWTEQTFKSGQYKRAKNCFDLMTRMRQYYMKHPSECLHFKYDIVSFQNGYTKSDFKFRNKIIDVSGDNELQLALYRCPFCDKLL